MSLLAMNNFRRAGFLEKSLEVAGTEPRTSRVGQLCQPQDYHHCPSALLSFNYNFYANATNTKHNFTTRHQERHHPCYLNSFDTIAVSLQVPIRALTSKGGAVAEWSKALQLRGKKTKI